MEEIFEAAQEEVKEAPKTIKTKLTCPHCNTEIVIEKPVTTRTRGSLHGIALKDMTMEQLKREKINANSVLYKATKRGAPAELIANNQVRVDAVVAEIAMRKPAPVVVAEVAPATEEVAPATEEVAPATEENTEY